MTGIKWLASYPKSGNTWARLFLLNYFADTNEPLNPNDLARVRFCPACDTKWLWEEATGLKTEQIDDLQSIKLRRHVQWYYQARPHDELPPFLKTHSYNGSFGPFPMVNWDNTSSAVYIVRDPRRIAPSLADHMGMGLDEAINLMANEDASLTRDSLTVFMSSWSEHVKSWQKSGAVIIRYEDLPDAFGIVLQALGLEHDSRAEKAKTFTEMQTLKWFESAEPFAEAVNGQRFFGGQRRELTGSQIHRIEESHSEVMREFGYL